MWSAPRPFLVLLLCVEVPAVVLIALTVTLVPLTGTHLIWFGVLAGLSVLHQESSSRIERMRELASEGTSYVDLKSIWTFAGLLILPPPLVAALIVITYSHSWLRVGKRIMPHRWIYSAATVVLASAAGAAILAVVYQSSYPVRPSGWGIAIVALVGAVRWAVNIGLVYVALPLMTPGLGWGEALRRLFGQADGQMEFTPLSIGAAVALTLTTDAPWLVVFAIPILLAHKGLLLRRFQHTAQQDSETGLLQMVFWKDLAAQLIEAARRLDRSAGLLMIRVDDLWVTTDHHGGPAAAKIVRVVADAVQSHVRSDDLLGRRDRENLVLLVPDITAADLAELAGRIQLAVQEIDPVEIDTPDGPFELPDLTVSVAGALYPHHATTLDELLLCAETALLRALSYGTNQVCILRHETPSVEPSLRMRVRPRL